MYRVASLCIPPSTPCTKTNPISSTARLSPISKGDAQHYSNYFFTFLQINVYIYYRQPTITNNKTTFKQDKNMNFEKACQLLGTNPNNSAEFLVKYARNKQKRMTQQCPLKFKVAATTIIRHFA